MLRPKLDQLAAPGHRVQQHDRLLMTGTRLVVMQPHVVTNLAP
jgi:hypothetical protein